MVVEGLEERVFLQQGPLLFLVEEVQGDLLGGLEEEEEMHASPSSYSVPRWTAVARP